MFNRKILSLIVVSLIIFAGCGAKKTEDQPQEKSSGVDTIAVQTESVTEDVLTLRKTFIATLEGEEQANVVAKVPERIVAINARVGSPVQKGQMLIELNKSGAGSQYYQAQAAFLNAQKDLERMKSLFAEGAISQQMLDGVQTQFNIYKANFDAAKDAIELTAPISGIVTAITVNPGDLASPGMPLITIANISRMKAVVSIGEKDMADLYAGQTVKVYSELRPDFQVTGKISEISKSANVQSRSFEMKALFANSGDRWFKPGMFCNVESEKRSSAKSLVLPSTAVVLKGSETGTYVVNNGKASYRKIITGVTDGRFTEVVSGVSKGDKVVTTGAGSVYDGATVYEAK
ncbi:MAG: efflux RND transporter periplasmic adaptor subunit [Ignavibacteriaceae bacterium]|nr:efflux RND transporter periplasmic adaptor subunit [Ignavibacteriaceae bacterium]